MRNYYTYIVSSADRDRLFIGVTDDLSRQLVMHWYDNRESFVPDKRVYFLLWYQRWERAVDAVAQARTLKRRGRDELLDYIKLQNPGNVPLNRRFVTRWPPHEQQVKEAVQWRDAKTLKANIS